MTLIRVAIVGPESSGKTTLCGALAQHYRCAYTKEYAREYLAEHGPGYTEEDLIHIAGGQVLVEAQAQQLLTKHGGRLVLCDTDMLTIRIWSEEKFGHVHPLLEKLAREVEYDLWLLCRPDIPWEPDPLREDPHDRDRLFAVYEQLLKQLRKPYRIMEGPQEKRLADAIVAITDLRS